MGKRGCIVRERERGERLEFGICARFESEAEEGVDEKKEIWDELR